MSSMMCDASTQTGDPKPVETKAPRNELYESGEAAAGPLTARAPRRERRRGFWKPIREKILSNREQRDAATDLQTMTSDSSAKTTLSSGERNNQARLNNISRRGGRGGRGGPGSRHNSNGRGGRPGSSLLFVGHMQGESGYQEGNHQSHNPNPHFYGHSQQVDQYMRAYPSGRQLQQVTSFGWPCGASQSTSYSHPSRQPVPQVFVSSHIDEAPLIVSSPYHDELLSKTKTSDKGHKSKLGGLTVSTEHDLMNMSSRTPLIVPAGDLDFEDHELEADCLQIDPVIPVTAVIPVTESSNLAPRGQEVDWDGQTNVGPHQLDEAQLEVVLGKEDTLPPNEALEERMQLVKELVAAGETRLAAALRSQSLSPTSDYSSFSFTDDSTVVDEPQELPASSTPLHSQLVLVGRKIGFDSPFAPRSLSEDQLSLPTLF